MIPSTQSENPDKPSTHKQIDVPPWGMLLSPAIRKQTGDILWPSQGPRLASDKHTSAILQSYQAVPAYLNSEQLLPLSFARQYNALQSHNAVTT